MFRPDGSVPDWASTRNYPGIDSPHGCGANSLYQACVYMDTSIKPAIIGPSGMDHLNPSVSLPKGTWIRSNNWDYKAILQDDGNFCVVNRRIPNYVPWATGTNGHNITNCVMQADGNFVLYEGSQAVFATGTDGHPGAALFMQDDGNLVIYDPSHQALWASNTDIY